MISEEMNSDPDLTNEQKQLAAELTFEQLKEIDETLFSNTACSWRKVARVIGSTMSELSSRITDLPDIFYSLRVRDLVESGKLISRGDLSCMRYSEVRRSDKTFK